MPAKKEQGLEEQSEQKVSITASRSAILFEGPLPHPAILKAYEDISSGLAERIVRQAEEQTRHRCQLERSVIEANINSQFRGQTLGFVLAVMVVAGGFFLMYLDKDAYGIAAILGSLATLLLAFMWGRKEQRKEREQAMQKLLKKTHVADAD